MLTEKEIDYLKYYTQTESEQDKAYVYYVAHMIEPREGIIDEVNYKDISKFKIIKLKVKDVNNAYFEYLNYIKNKINYHIEQEECYYDINTKYINEYIVPNASESYNKEFNCRIPSIIFGIRRKVFDANTNELKEIIDETPIKHKFINIEDMFFMNEEQTRLYTELYMDDLSWKYKQLEYPEICDGIEYQYITSDWYILDIENFPSVEKPLINVKEKNAYFMNLNDAFNYLDQLIA